MGYPNTARLGDIGSDITGWLTNLNQETRNLQTDAQQLAAKIVGAGNAAVQAGNTVTGAAAGAKTGAQAGASVPVTNPLAALAQLPTPVKYGGVALLAWLFLRR